ncbi:hypothetical protein RYZ27_12620 [Hyphomonas sp. FCG-A18]|uniref:hypothetical protein n=1 Tax=Hyphomonas sp. FCG-A18 TaxID=3080019 RepID=UPI002B29008B|nr:hypothetical protein RYZ27_12620 [Hyphomonas sp. FCG-A18]
MTPNEIRTLLIESGVPENIAVEVSTYPIDLSLFKKQTWVFIGFSIAFFSLPLVFLFGYPNPEHCNENLPHNIGASFIMMIFAAIFIAGWVTIHVQRSGSYSKRVSIFVGSFADDTNAPLARFMAKRLKARDRGVVETESYIDQTLLMPLPFFKWPAMILIPLAILAFIFMPASCL